ncbi:MAG: tetratricopeptide repeat protein [Terracidiphilus sp.]
MNSKIQHIALACLLCIDSQFLAQAPSETASAPAVTVDPLVMTWKPNGPGCDDRYENGLEEKGLFTNQASLIVFLIPDSGKLAVFVYVGNPAEGAGRIDVNPESIHLFKATDKGLSELKRADAAQMAKSTERRVRIVQSIAAGLSAAGGSETTANGTVNYSDGTTADYSVTMPNPQAQTDAINRAHERIGEARNKGANLVREELKRTTLDPGHHIMGRLFFPNQKSGDGLLVRADIGNVRYEIPFHLPRKHEAKVAPSATQREDSRPPQQAAATAVDAAQQTMPTDPVQKAAWYRKAADQGDAGAQSFLGWLYASGQGVPQDYAQAAIWFRKAADQGDAGAQFNLGLSYAKGQGLAQDYTQAAVWYRKAAEQGEARAQHNLGWLYDNGQGVPQDYAQAAVWYQKAAEQNYAPAQRLLASLYFLGHGVPQDYGEATAWGRKAADQGDVRAQYGLGLLYNSGQGVTQSYAEAYFWLNLAAARSKGKEQERFAKARDEAAAKLAPDDLSKAQQRAAAWFAAHPLQP